MDFHLYYLSLPKFLPTYVNVRPTFVMRDGSSEHQPAGRMKNRLSVAVNECPLIKGNMRSAAKNCNLKPHVYCKTTDNPSYGTTIRSQLRDDLLVSMISSDASIEGRKPWLTAADYFVWDHPLAYRLAPLWNLMRDICVVREFEFRDRHNLFSLQPKICVDTLKHYPINQSRTINGTEDSHVKLQMKIQRLRTPPQGTGRKMLVTHNRLKPTTIFKFSYCFENVNSKNLARAGYHWRKTTDKNQDNGSSADTCGTPDGTVIDFMEPSTYPKTHRPSHNFGRLKQLVPDATGHQLSQEDTIIDSTCFGEVQDLCSTYISCRLQGVAIYPSPKINGEQSYGSHNECQASTWFLQLMMKSASVPVRYRKGTTAERIPRKPPVCGMIKDRWCMTAYVLSNATELMVRMTTYQHCSTTGVKSASFPSTNEAEQMESQEASVPKCYENYETTTKTFKTIHSPIIPRRWHVSRIVSNNLIGNSDETSRRIVVIDLISLNALLLKVTRNPIAALWQLRTAPFWNEHSGKINSETLDGRGLPTDAIEVRDNNSNYVILRYKAIPTGVWGRIVLPFHRLPRKREVHEDWMELKTL
ncbi:hypothetical protein CLF_107601 [Clonorchis sinensis]|uniref:Uncharacterized protein n=1 Tax=Clonorchis sinensis TaxID=79923 RepID=G7YGX9_CLOSI|nr:hypothetical protein CLF_107601 [Clonorchis sinensis]